MTTHDHYASNSKAQGHTSACALVTAPINWPTLAGRPACSCEQRQEIKAGDRVRSLDFAPDTSTYVEGVVEGTTAYSDNPGFRDCVRYIILVERKVRDNVEIVGHHLVGQRVYPPLNGTPTSMGRITNGVIPVS